MRKVKLNLVKLVANNLEMFIPAVIIIIVLIIIFVRYPDQLTGYGTILTAIIALYIAFLPRILEHKNRPLLKIEFENKEPYCRYSIAPSINVKAYWIRLKVANVGSSVAKRCEGRLDKITDAKTGEELTDFDPVVLHWVGLSWAHTRYDIINRIDINASAHEYLDIIHTENTNQSSEIQIATVDRTPKGIHFSLKKRDYKIHITIYSENAEPIQETFKLELIGDAYDKVRLLPVGRT